MGLLMNVLKRGLKKKNRALSNTLTLQPFYPFDRLDFGVLHLILLKGVENEFREDPWVQIPAVVLDFVNAAMAVKNAMFNPSPVVKPQPSDQEFGVSILLSSIQFYLSYVC